MAGLMICGGRSARATLLSYEGFNYAEGTSIAGQSGGDSFGWAGSWATGSGNGFGTNVAGSLSYTDFFGHTLVTDGGSIVVSSVSGSTAATPNRTLASTLSQGSGRTLWLSFLAQRIGPTNGAASPPFYDRQANLGLFQTSNERLDVGRPNTNSFAGAPYDTWCLWHVNGTANNGTGFAQPSTYPLHNPSGASFLVLRIDTDGTTANDAVWLWLNLPDLSVTPDPSTATLTDTGFVDLSSVNNLRLAANGASGALTNAFMQFDEIRVGTAFADVAPYGTNAVPLPALAITNVLLGSDGIELSGTGGPNGGVYRVLAATSLQTALSDWALISTNVFDGYGNFHSTNPISPGAGQEYFRLLLGGTLPPPPIGPSITAQPADRTVKIGQTAAFSVSANGTPPLFYQWFFNTNTPLTDRTNSTLTIAGAQTNDAGGYSVRIANSANSVTSVVAVLTVLPPAPPSIGAQPGDLTASEGQTAVFNVVADGYAPLTYQWFFNSTNLLADATNAFLALTNVEPGNAGGYSVLVTNNLGSQTSVVATLTVVPPTGAPDFSLFGYATANGGTTGGEGGATVTVTNSVDFKNALSQDGPLIVRVAGTIDLATTILSGKSDKTIVGLGTNAILLGNLQLQYCTNMIVRNVQSINPAGDGMSIQNFTEHLWVDHCTFGECGDGQIDITHGCDFITVSWCQFAYTNAANAHRFSSLVGHDDANGFEDEGRLHITYHHNVWGALVRERMPRVRFGGVHVYNTYFNAPGNNYCTLAATNAQLRIENNYYQSVDEPWRKETTGRIKASGNVFVSVTNNNVPAADDVTPPAYSYCLDPAASVPELVTNNAGAGKGPFAP